MENGKKRREEVSDLVHIENFKKAISLAITVLHQMQLLQLVL